MGDDKRRTIMMTFLLIDILNMMNLSGPVMLFTLKNNLMVPTLRLMMEVSSPTGILFQ